MTPQRAIRRLGFVCPQCGPNQASDEDGCCVGCGATCCSQEMLAGLLARLDKIRGDAEPLPMTPRELLRSVPVLDDPEVSRVLAEACFRSAASPPAPAAANFSSVKPGDRFVARPGIGRAHIVQTIMPGGNAAIAWCERWLYPHDDQPAGTEIPLCAACAKATSPQAAPPEELPTIPDYWPRFGEPQKAILRGGWVIILGEPPDEEQWPDGTPHSCDEMGCPSIGYHALARWPAAPGGLGELLALPEKWEAEVAGWGAVVDPGGEQGPSDCELERTRCAGELRGLLIRLGLRAALGLPEGE